MFTLVSVSVILVRTRQVNSNIISLLHRQLLKLRADAFVGKLQEGSMSAIYK